MNELFHHDPSTVDAVAAAVAEQADERAGLVCMVADPVKPEDRVRTAREVLFGE